MNSSLLLGPKRRKLYESQMDALWTGWWDGRIYAPKMNEVNLLAFLICFCCLARENAIYAMFTTLHSTCSNKLTKNRTHFIVIRGYMVHILDKSWFINKGKTDDNWKEISIYVLSHHENILRKSLKYWLMIFEMSTYWQKQENLKRTLYKF